MKATKRQTRELAKAAEKRRHAITAGFVARHPEKAREERELRKRHGAAQRDFGHKRNGTIETHQHAERTRQGSLSRMFEAGQLSIDELAAACEIQAVFERLSRDASVATASLESHVDQSRSFDGTFFEKLGAVRAEIAYGRWRRSLARPAMVLAMIVDNLSVTAAAKANRMRTAKTRGILLGALNAWSDEVGRACKEIDHADLAAMQAGLI